MKWRWTEEERRAEWEKWRTQGKAAFLWRVAMLRMALPWGAVMLIYFLFFAPGTDELPIMGYLAIFAMTVVIAVLFGLFTGFTTWWWMTKKYG